MKSRMLVGALALAMVVLVAARSEGQSPEASPAAEAEPKSFTMVNIKYEGTNVWVPGPIIVKKGDKVKIRLINNVKDDPAEHGFAIEEFKVQAVVKRGEPQTVEFTADKAGIFKTSCHLHLPHVGNQLVVLE